MQRADDELFVAENRVCGEAALHSLQSLALKALRVKIVCGEDCIQHLSKVVDLLGRNSGRLELDQPLGDIDDEPVFVVGDALFIYWSDDGRRYGAQAIVVEVNVHEDVPSYVADLRNGVYCQTEKRVQTRMPVNQGDGVKAQLRVTGHEATLSPAVKDISCGGIQLIMSVTDVVSAGIKTKGAATLWLSFARNGEEFRSRISFVWMARITRQDISLGCAWETPSEAFVQQIQHFITSKEQRLEAQHSPTLAP